MDRLYVCSDERNCYASEVSLLLERTAGKNGFGQYFSNETASIKYFDFKFNGTVDSRTMTMFTGDIEIRMRGWGNTTFVTKGRYEAQKDKYEDAKLVIFCHDKNIVEAAHQFLDDAQSDSSNRYEPVNSLLSAHYIEELYGDYGCHGRKDVSSNFMNAVADSMLPTQSEHAQFTHSASQATSVCVIKEESEDFPVASTVSAREPLEELYDGNLAEQFKHIIFITSQPDNNAPLVEIYKKDLGRVFAGYIDNHYALSQVALLVGIRHEW